MVAQKRTMRESSHEFAKRCSIISSPVFSGVVPLNRCRSTGSIAAPFFILAYFLFPSAMRNKYNDKFTEGARTQGTATATLLTIEIVGLFGRTLHKVNAVDFLRPLVGCFQGRSIHSGTA
jgi:hypothetical protein